MVSTIEELATDRKDAETKLSKLTGTMELPQFRKTDARWLGRNMVVRNRTHTNFKEADALIRFILKKGWV